MRLLERESRDVVRHALVRQHEHLAQRLVALATPRPSARSSIPRAQVATGGVVATAEEIEVGLGERRLEARRATRASLASPSLCAARYANAVCRKSRPAAARFQCSRAAASSPSSACSSPESYWKRGEPTKAAMPSFVKSRAGHGLSEAAARAAASALRPSRARAKARRSFTSR